MFSTVKTAFRRLKNKIFHRVPCGENSSESPSEARNSGLFNLQNILSVPTSFAGSDHRRLELEKG
jgi:hypothetical protein